MAYRREMCHTLTVIRTILNCRWQKLAVASLVLAALTCSALPFPVHAGARSSLPWMPEPGALVRLSPAFVPAHLKGVIINPEEPFRFDFLVQKGGQALNDVQKRAEYTKLAKYFLASLAIPDDHQWVNLSPYEKNRITPADFAKTEMGRDILAQDYLLKQIASSLIYPEDRLGREFWDKVFAETRRRYGTTDVPVRSVNKVWVIPDDVLIYEKAGGGPTRRRMTAYILENHLRVMMDEDYLALRKNGAQTNGMARGAFAADSKVSQKVMRDIIIPALQKEVNEGRNFAPLRQVYSGMLLAAWYKRTLKDSLLGRIYADRAKVQGVAQDPAVIEGIYQQYLRAYKKGVFDFIRTDTHGEGIPRKYFSGGAAGYAMMRALTGKDIVVSRDARNDQAMKADEPDNDMAIVKLIPVRKAVSGTKGVGAHQPDRAMAGDVSGSGLKVDDHTRLLLGKLLTERMPDETIGLQAFLEGLPPEADTDKDAFLRGWAGDKEAQVRQSLQRFTSQLAEKLAAKVPQREFLIEITRLFGRPSRLAERLEIIARRQQDVPAGVVVLHPETDVARFIGEVSEDQDVLSLWGREYDRLLEAEFHKVIRLWQARRELSLERFDGQVRPSSSVDGVAVDLQSRHNAPGRTVEEFMNALPEPERARLSSMISADMHMQIRGTLLLLPDVVRSTFMGPVASKADLVQWVRKSVAGTDELKARLLAIIDNVATDPPAGVRPLRAGINLAQFVRTVQSDQGVEDALKKTYRSWLVASLEVPSEPQRPLAPVTWKDKVKAGYSLRSYSEEDVKAPVSKRVDLLLNGRKVPGSNIAIRIYPDQKIAYLTAFYPDFPARHQPGFQEGSGRALLAHLLTDVWCLCGYSIILTPHLPRPDKDFPDIVTALERMKGVVDILVPDGGAREELQERAHRMRTSRLEDIQHQSFLQMIIQERDTVFAKVADRPDKAGTADSAMKGGIDLNASHVRLRIARDGGAMPLPEVREDNAMLGGMEGLVPRIVAIQPAGGPLPKEIR